LLWPNSPDARANMLRAVQLADHVRYSHPEIHRDFHALLRFGKAKSVLRDGLAGDTLGIEAFLLPALRMLKPWPLTRVLNIFGLRNFMIWRGTTLPIRSAPLIGVLSCSSEDGGFTSGRVLERIWLAAETAGLAFQPLGALPLLLHRMRQGGSGLSASHRTNLALADAAWRRAVGIDSDTLIMIFRLGYSRVTPSRALRRSLESFWNDLDDLSER
jgi:hypothetical protein